MSVIIFTNFSQTALLLHRFSLPRLCFLVLCHVFGVGRYHHEQILKRYEQSKPTFTSSNKNIDSLSGENRTIILFRTDGQL